jgi:cytochrome P450
MWLHPSVGFLMERTHFRLKAPPSVDGTSPGGTIVGINPWATGRNEDVFPAPEAFKPERWLEAITEDQLRENGEFVVVELRRPAARTCLGQHISLIEIHKVVPQLLRTFKVELGVSRQGSGIYAIIGSCSKRDWFFAH